MHPNKLTSRIVTGIPDAPSPPPAEFFSPEKQNALRQFTHYIWWGTEAEKLRFPARLLAQVMTFGTLEDMNAMEDLFAKKNLQWVLRHAEPGMLNARSWHYWHYRLELAKNPSEVPSMPVRKIPPDSRFDFLQAA